MTTPASRAAQFLGFHTPSFRHRLWPSLVVLLIWGWLGGVAFAQSPQIVVNGVGAPGPVTATGGMALTVTVTNGPAGPTDWVGLYQAGRPDNEWIDWKYLSDSQTAPTVGMTSGTVLFLTPPAGGAYEVRFFSAGSFTRLAVGPGITAAAGQTTNIASGSVHTLVVLPDRTVMSWGSGAQIGDGTPTNQNVRKAAAVKVRIAEKLITDVVDPPELTDVTAVAATATSSAAIKSDGTLWTWGQNTYGLLGDGTSATRGWAKQIALSGVVALAGGANHVLALKSDGSVYAWGSNGYGQIGNGAISGTWVTTPVAVSALGNTVIAIGAAGNTSYAIKANGTLWVWGSNQYGEVGNGTTSAYVTTPTQATTGGVAMVGVTGGSDRTYAWTATGALYAWGYNGSGQLGIGNTVQKLTPTLVPSLTNVTKVVAGLSHALAQRSDNTLWSWGFNANGQLGDGTNTQRLAPQQVTTPTGVSAIAASDNYSVAVGTDGRVTVWGGNFSGQLGDSTTWDRWSPQQIINPGFVIRTLRPNFSISGGTYLSTGTLRVYINAWTPSSTVRYTTDGTTPTTGSPSLVPGGFLDLPQNTTLQAMATSPGAPASLVENATYALKVQAPSVTPGSGTFTSQTNVGLTSTTANTAIRYTLDGSTPTSGSTAYTSAIPLTTGTTVKAIATRVNWLDSDVLTSTYTFNYGTLATPTAAPAGGAFQGSVTVTLSGPANATIRYTTNGTDPTTASTAYSAPLVFGTTTTLKAKAFRTDYTPSATLTQTYTITTAAPVLSRNSGAYDPGTRVTITTGDPSATLRMTLSGVDPTSTDPVVASGSSLLVGAYTLKVRAFKSGAIDSVVTAGIYTLTGALVGGDAAAGGSHTLLATPGGLVYGWGDNGYGQLGDSSTTSRSTPRLIQTLTGVSRLAAGVTHSVGTTMDGLVYTWGGNGYGQLGDGTTNSRSAPYLVSLPSPVKAVAAGYYHTLALTASGTVYAWGWGSTGQLGLGTSANVSTPTLIAGLTNIVAIAAGQFHSLAVTASGQVYAWGWNANGQLGDGTTSQRLTPTLLTSLTGVTSVAAGGTYSLARTSTGAVYAWGYGPSGEMGLGATTSRTSPMQVAGLSAQAIAAGAGHSAALRTDGSIATWGTNSAGQLGDGTTTPRTTPVSAAGLATMAVVSVGSAHTVAVRSDGAVFTWGTGASGRLGDGGAANRVTPFNVFTGGGVWGTPAPVLSLPPGIYRTTQTLGVSAPLGATVRYTTNGQPPTEADTLLATGSALPLTANVTMAFRSWLPGLAPSSVTIAAYEFQPLPPNATPAAGTYLAAQAVTLSAAAGTTIRYTIDGSVPTVASAPYSAPIQVSSPTTITAAAFHDGWTPSQPVTVPYIFALSAPTLTPPSGTVGPAQPIALTAFPGATIRYTLDGSTPTLNSPVYTGPFGVSGTVTVKAIATMAGWLDSQVASGSYSGDATGPTVTLTYSPLANAAGWNWTPVTVSFICSDSGAGVATCPSPVLFDAEGAGQSVNVVATDLVGNITNIAATVNVDLTPPTVALTGPVVGSTTSVPNLLMTGTAEDLLSGIDSVACNGISGNVSSGAFTCDVPLGPGRNDIAMVVRDVAGHSASAGLVVNRVGASSAVRIDPGTRTLLVGETQQLRALDEYGVPPSSPTWSSSDPLIANVDANGSVTAVSAGLATITAQTPNLTTTAEVVVVAGTELPVGTVRWAITPTPGGQLQHPVYTHRITPTAPDMFSAEVKENVGISLRAISSSGETLWSGQARAVPIFGDSFGGVVGVVHGQIDEVTRFGGPESEVPWSFISTGRVSGLSQGPDGTIYLVETVGGLPNEQVPGVSRFFVVVDGRTGAVQTRKQLPGYIFERDISYLEYSSHTRDEYPPLVTEPVIGSDGRGYVQVAQHGFREINKPGQREKAYDFHLSLVGIDKAGASTTVPIHSYVFTDNELDGLEWVEAAPTPRQVVPESGGGILAIWSGGATASERNVTRFGPTGARQDHSFAGPDSAVVLAGDGGTVYYRLASGSLTAVDVETWTEKWTTPVPGDPVMALANGGVALQSASTMSVIDNGGHLVDTANIPLAGVATSQEYGYWQGVSFSGNTVQMAGPLLQEALYEFSPLNIFIPAHSGNREGQNAAKDLRQGIYAKTHNFRDNPFVRARHIAIMIIPRNQEYWRGHEPEIFNKPVPGYPGLFFGTLGAGPVPGGTIACVAGVMHAEFNRPDDWQQTPAIRPERLTPSAGSEDLWIQELIARQRTFMRDHNGELDYACPPITSWEDGWNSNGYARGLLQASGVPLPVFPSIDGWYTWPVNAVYPGWQKPIPLEMFMPQPAP